MIDLEKKSLLPKMKNKKALSQVVSVTVLILLTVVLIGAVWTIVNSFLSDKLEGAQSCMNVFETIQLNPKYTCFNATSNETLVSITRGDIDDVTSLLISVTYTTDSENFELTNTSKTITGLLNYPSRTTSVILPSKDQGRTFIVTRQGKPESIQIAPKMGKKQCDVADQIMAVSNCN